MTGRVAGHGAWMVAAAGIALASPVFAQEYRSLDGTGNNLKNPLWGSNGQRLIRRTPAGYADGFASPAGPDRPSSRLVSNLVSLQEQTQHSPRVVSNVVMQWGQWIDHDLGFKRLASPAEPFNIPVPTGDPFFDPSSSGTAALSFTRSRYDPASGTGPGNPRQQVNSVSSYIDSHTVYGWNAGRAATLRSFQGGRLAVQTGDIIPWNTALEPMDTSPFGVNPLAQVLLAGDDRANTTILLLSMHTLWVREHNRLCAVLAAANPSWDDEKLYQEARRRVIALNAHVTFNEYLPAILGKTAVPPYGGYNDRVNATQSNEFAHAAFRFGHSQINQLIARLEENGFSIPQGAVRMRDQFFTPEKLFDDGGIDPIFRGMAFQPIQKVDFRITFDVRNFLYGPPDLLGLDLASFNIQRGRDHGLASYTQARVALGLPPVTSFSQVSADPLVAQRLAAAYGNIDQVDLWVGGLCEDAVPGSMLGPLFHAIVRDEFLRVRTGDRLWFENGQFSAAELAEIKGTMFSDVILRNTGIARVQRNVFHVWPDIDLNNVLSVADFGTFQNHWVKGDLNCDFNKDGVLTIDDFLAFEIAFASY
ncbi:MAG: peroxidase family protein [Phycisphaerales bacterium]